MALCGDIRLRICYHAGKHGVLVEEQILRRVHLTYPALVEYYHAVIVHNCVLKTAYFLERLNNGSYQSVRNGEDGGLRKLASNGLLDDHVRRQVYGCGSLVENENARSSKKSARKAHQLALTDATQQTDKFGS